MFSSEILYHVSKKFADISVTQIESKYIIHMGDNFCYIPFGMFLMSDLLEQNLPDFI